MSVLIEYFEALERLKSGRPVRVPRDTKITNDSVALEAGRSKGSIKRSRDIFAELIEAIDEAMAAQARPRQEDRTKAMEAKAKAQSYRAAYEDSLAREVMLIEKIDQLEIELAKYRKIYGNKVKSINSHRNLEME